MWLWMQCGKDVHLGMLTTNPEKLKHGMEMGHPK